MSKRVVWFPQLGVVAAQFGGKRVIQPTSLFVAQSKYEIRKVQLGIWSGKNRHCTSLSVLSITQSSPTISEDCKMNKLKIKRTQGAWMILWLSEG